MKTIKYSILMMLGVFFLASCEQDNEFVNDVQGGEKPNLVMFNNSTNSINRYAKNGPHDIEFTMKVRGPRMKDVSGDITVTVEPNFDGIEDKVIEDPDAENTNQRAEEGTNFNLPSKKLTLKESDNYIGQFHLDMLTKGITAPLSTPKKLNLRVTNVSGSKSVKPAKQAKVDLNYACPSFLEGLYDITVNGDQTKSGIKVYSTGIGEYESEVLPPFGYKEGDPNDLANGLKFTEICDDLTVKNKTLAPFTNAIKDNGGNTFAGDTETEGGINDFTLHYNVDGQGDYTTTFTYQGPLPQ